MHSQSPAPTATARRACAVLWLLAAVTPARRLSRRPWSRLALYPLALPRTHPEDSLRTRWGVPRLRTCQLGFRQELLAHALKDPELDVEGILRFVNEAPKSAKPGLVEVG